MLLVLNAVLALLVGCKRIGDDQLRLNQISYQFPAGARWLTPTTVGRLLAKLAGLELITYQCARGRGGCAQIAIHPAFLDGIRELQRDSAGRVVTENSTPCPRPAGWRGGSGSAENCPLCAGSPPKPKASLDPVVGAENVNFSAERFLIEDLSPKTPLPPAADGPVSDPHQTRPSEVAVAPGAVAAVLAALPDCYRTAPTPLRWHIGAAVKRQLALGWAHEQIVATLAAPLPDQVRTPLMLARWRLAKNQGWAGPRLRRLQQAWDRAHAAAQRARHANQQARAYTAVIAEVGPVAGRRMAECAGRQASAVLGVWAQPSTPAEQRATEQAAVVQVARMARRDHPGQPLRDAVTAWLAAHQPPPAPATSNTVTAPGPVLTVADLITATPAGRCVQCRSVGAITRGDLPIPVPVCEDCWQDAVCEDACQQESDPTQATAAGVEARGRREAC